VRGLLILVAAFGFESGFEPVDSGVATARTKIVASNPRIRSGSAPLKPGNARIGMKNETLGVYGLFE